MYYFIWFILLFTSSEGFGLRNESWGGLGNSPLGWYGLLQFIVLIASLTIPFITKQSLFFNLKTKMALPAKLILLLIVVIIIQSLAVIAGTDNLSLSEMLTNLIKFKFIILYFLFTYLLTRPNGIQIAIRTIVLSGIISTIVVLIVINWGYENTAISIHKSTAIGREFRLLLPSAMLITFSYFYFISKYGTNKKLIYLGGILINLIGIVLQMHRNVLISTTIITAFSVIKIYGLRIKNIFYVFIFAGIIFMGIYIVSGQIGYSENQLTNNITNTTEEVETASGTFAVRFFLPINSFVHVVENYYIIGVGLNWEKIDDKDYYHSLKRYYATPTFDSGYNNIIIIYGLMGIFIYIFLFIRLYKVLNRIINKTKNVEYKIISYSLMFTLFYYLLTSFASDKFFLQEAAAIFTLIISFTYVLELKLINKNE